MKKSILFAAVAILAATATARAQSDSPYAGYVYPAGGQIGSTFEVTVGGVNLEDTTYAHCTGGGIDFEILGYYRPINQGAYKELQNELYALINRQKDGEELTPEELARMDELYGLVATFDVRKASIAAEAETVKLRVTIDADADPGNRELRLQAENGLTNPLIYQVGESPEFSEMSVRDFVSQRNEEELRGAAGKLEESDEKEDPGATPITTEPEVPSDISVPSVVNGQIPPGDYDLYRFHAASGQKLVLNAHARRLIPYVSDGVPGWFQATLTIYDAEGNEAAYNDDYRFHPDPVIYFEVPETGDYILEIRDSVYRGRESFVYRIEIGETPFVTSVFPMGGPAGTARTVELRGWNLPVTELAVPPLEPGVTAVAAEFATFLPEGAPYAVGDLPEVMEQGANNEPSSAERVDVPVIVTDFVPGQEAGNVEWVVQHGAGLFERDPERIADRIAALLQPNRTDLEGMARRAYDMAQPTAADDIIREALNHHGTSRKAARDRSGAPSATDRRWPGPPSGRRSRRRPCRPARSTTRRSGRSRDGGGSSRRRPWPPPSPRAI